MKKNTFSSTIIFPIIAMLFLLITSCGNSQQKTKEDAGSTINQPPPDKNGPYDFVHPVNKWELPADLKEISGIVWKDNEHFIAIEDLHPTIYLLKTGDGKASIEKNFVFNQTSKDKFDIEDVAMDGNTIYALWSHGEIFKINNWDSKPEVKEVKTFLTKENNTEGLCVDPVSGNLLVACKDAAGVDEEKKSTRAVYSYLKNGDSLATTPFMIIQKKELEEAAGQKIGFYPSAIAVHPVTHEIYIMSTKDDKCLAIFTHDGKFESFHFLDRENLLQPEGISFSPDGRLFISTEGKQDKSAYIFEYKAMGK
jgi:hypothetical protein